MSISMAEVRKLAHIPKVIVHSLDLMLYQVSIELDGTEHMVTDSKGKMLRAHSTLEMQTLFEDLPVAKLVLRHQSAYDEMINQPLRQGSNMLEVPLGRNRLGTVKQTIQ